MVMNKLNGGVLVAVAMMLGAFGAIGCNNAKDDGAQQESAPAAQPAPVVVQTKAATPASNDEARTIPAGTTVGTEQDSLRFRVDVPFAPPAARFENPGRPPSARHFWVNGYHRYVGGRYVWVGGRWDVRREGHIFVQPRYDRFGSRVRYVPGHWVRR
jgi:hypothetical protein